MGAAAGRAGYQDQLTDCRLPLEHTDAALREQLALEDEGFAATTEPGHAAVRYTNPTTGGDVMPTIRTEFHRLRAGALTRARRDVGSTVYQVFEGSGTFHLEDAAHAVGKGDLIVVPSWVSWSVCADTDLDLFSFSGTALTPSRRNSKPALWESGRRPSVISPTGCALPADVPFAWRVIGKPTIRPRGHDAHEHLNVVGRGTCSRRFSPTRQDSAG